MLPAPFATCTCFAMQHVPLGGGEGGGIDIRRLVVAWINVACTGSFVIKFSILS